MEAQEGILCDPVTAYQNTSLYVLLVLQLKVVFQMTKIYN
jgi:hypothetical protein